MQCKNQLHKKRHWLVFLDLFHNNINQGRQDRKGCQDQQEHQDRKEGKEGQGRQDRKGHQDQQEHLEGKGGKEDKVHPEHLTIKEASLSA